MIRVAIIGTNIISDSFVDAVYNCDGIYVVAVYSRTYEKGKEFAKKHKIECVMTDIYALAKSENIDAVYIASPNYIHYEQSIIMLSNKKHVLCEKTIASNLYELNHMISVARENNVLILEAMRPIFDIGLSYINENIHKLGKIRNIFFEYCQYSSRYNNYKKGIIENAFKKELSNGALMDIGVYCVNLLVRLFSMPKNIHSTAIKLENGVDAAGTIICDYGDMNAILNYSKISDGYLKSHIQGENATMLISSVHSLDEIMVCHKNEEYEVIKRQPCKNNMVYEINKFVDIIRSGNYDNTYIKNSVMALTIMDTVRKQNNIVFPADNKK